MDSTTRWRLVMQKQVDGLAAEVRSIKSIMIASGDIDNVIENKLKFFNDREEMTKVYLECDGEQTVGEIAQELGMHRPNVSRAIKNLLRQLLIFKTQNSRGKNTYARDNFYEVIGLIDELRK